MQPREKILAGALAAVVAVFALRSAFDSVFIEPLRDRDTRITTLEASVGKLEDEEFLLLAATRQLSQWRAESLPPDAYDAEREYREWLYAVAQLSGWEDPEIVPGGRNTRNASFTGVSTTIEGAARFSGITRFLDLMETTALLQRISRLEIRCESPEGDPLMTVSVTLEGLAMTDAVERSRLFPTTQLAEGLSDGDGEVVVESLAAFPETAPFHVRINDELLNVTGIDGNVLQVDREAGGTFSSDHGATDPVELFPLRESESDPRPLAIHRIFVKPPDFAGEMRFAELPPAIRGRNFSYQLEVQNWDPRNGEPHFQLLDGAPPGLSFNPSSGELNWDLEDDAELATYELEVAAYGDDPAESALEDIVFLEVRRPNRPPRLSSPDMIDAWLGRSLTFVPEVEDEDFPEEELSFSLDGDVPSDVDFDRQTGKLSWIPEVTEDLGELELELTVTDSGIPPESATVQLVFNLLDDSAMYTFLVGTIVQGEDHQAWLYDRSTSDRTLLVEGRDFQIADVSGTVEAIRIASIDIRHDGALYQLAVGENLREWRLIEAAESDETSSATESLGAVDSE